MPNLEQKVKQRLNDLQYSGGPSTEYETHNQRTLNEINLSADGMELKTIVEQLLEEVNCIVADYNRSGYSDIINDDLEYLQERCVDLLDMTKDSFADDREILQRIAKFSLEFNLEIKRIA